MLHATLPTRSALGKRTLSLQLLFPSISLGWDQFYIVTKVTISLVHTLSLAMIFDHASLSGNRCYKLI